MKINDYLKLENYLKVAKEQLEMAYEEIDTSEDQEWSEDFNKALTEISSLYESIIFCFKIED